MKKLKYWFLTYLCIKSYIWNNRDSKSTKHLLWCLNKTESIPSVIEQEAGYTLEIRTAVYYGAFVDGLLQEGKVS